MSYPDPLQNELLRLAEALKTDTSEMTVVKIKPGKDERHKELELLQGSWHDDHPWIVIGEDGDTYTLASAESFSKLIVLLASAQSENFQHKLEKAIYQRFPVDFDDVWAVAMDRIRRLAHSRPKENIVRLDLDWLVQEIRKEYPNLFYHIDQMLTPKED